MIPPRESRRSFGVDRRPDRPVGDSGRQKAARLWNLSLDLLNLPGRAG
jgi:hypothetical protein